MPSWKNALRIFPGFHGTTEIPDMTAPNVNTLWAQVMVDEFARSGLKAVVISPGSRSAPLVFQFNEHPSIEDYSVVDERSAGFFALGLARSLRTPVALLCTSGTAAANYFPAICEADRAGVPLLVLTADRLRDEHECGAQQVMEQDHLYGVHVRWYQRLAQPEASADRLSYLRSITARAIQKTRSPWAGPVHLNVPFRKPLEPVPVATEHRDHVPANLAEQARAALPGRPDGQPWVRVSQGRPMPDPAVIQDLIGRVHNSRRPLILAGADLRGTDYREALRDFAARAGIPVLAEPASGLRHWQARGMGILATGDLIAASDFYQRHGQPDLILRTGHAPLSWPLQAFCHSTATVPQVVVSATPVLADPEHRAGDQIIADERELFTALTASSGVLSPQRADWLDTHTRAAELASSRLRTVLDAHAELSSPVLWHRLGGLLPADSLLFFSSSMLVRHLDTFMCTHRRDLEVHFNRGLNGIDGIISTAAGLAAGRRHDDVRSEAPTVLVIGDVALRHDLAALLLVIEMDLDLTVIVVDNDGGEIFEYLPSAGLEPAHEKHFATGGRLPLADILPSAVTLCEVGDWSGFHGLVEQALDRPGLDVIRVPTSRLTDRQLRDDLIARVAGALDDIASPASRA
jgi:2-succinyl-5-enolpyruvyl-6-hydroxy-3-cyclohexene-1-carboxylate synthase